MDTGKHRPVALIILDGFGVYKEYPGNAVRLARTPNVDHWSQIFPYTEMAASGRDVGLPAGQMGNSEVGHLNLGAGFIVDQWITRLDKAIEDGSFFANDALIAAIDTAKQRGTALHTLGLLGNGGVHASDNHLRAVLKLAHDRGLEQVYVHAFTDGRDTPPQSAADDVARLAKALPEGVPVGTVSGRYFAMDRDKRWDRVAKAYAVLADAEGPRFPDPVAAIKNGYAHNTFDEFIVPAVIGSYAGMRDGDGILCFNFRADRVREILGALLDKDFDGFPRKRNIGFAAALGMTRYSDDLAPLMSVLFPPEEMQNILGAVAAAAGRTQLRMAETEKYPHVTYFLNGGQETCFPKEERILVPSPKVATYDLQPEMSAPELTDKAVEAIRSGKFDLIVLNYANPDMVGHTGSLPAAIKAVETVDTGLGRIADAVRDSGGALIVTADHGNCELMKDPATGGPHTAHTTNPVPVFLMGGKADAIQNGRLADLAPTLLELMGLKQPTEMTGTTLIVRHGARGGS